ncbi:MAG: hypothetical protein GF331_00735 [Chitinivibrionales bacterium]|nr:hypothetical protein [Chitinivibrionales bacterium]
MKVILPILLLSAVAGADVLTLAEAEHAAVTTGYDMRAQHFKVRAKEWEKRNALANYLPSIEYNATYMRMDPESYNASKDMMQALGGGGAAPGGAPPMTEAELARSPFAVYERSLKHEFKLNQPITNGGRELFAINIARNTMAAVRYEQEAARLQAIHDARKAYFDALSARERTNVAHQTLAWNRQNLAKARVRHETGAIPITDVLQWEADVAQKEGELLEAQATERFMLLTLYQTMGIPPHKADTTVELQPLETYVAWYDRGPATLEGTVDSNPTYQSVQAYTEVSEGATNIALGEMLPSINAFVNYGWPAYDDFLPPENTRSWTAGVVATVPLFKGFRGLTGWRKAKDEYRKAVVEKQQVANQLAVNLDRLAAFYRAAYGKVAASRKQSDLMKKQLEIMQQRYDAGLVNQSQLLEVELGMRQTRIAYIMALFECLMYEAQYRQNVGNLEVSS